MHAFEITDNQLPVGDTTKKRVEGSFSPEQLEAKMFEVAIDLFKKKVGFISEEIREVIKDYLDRTTLITDKKLLFEFETEGLGKKITLGRLAEALVDLKDGCFMVKGDNLVVFTNKGDSKNFLHEMSHYVEHVIEELLEIGLLVRSESVELYDRLEKDHEKYYLNQLRETISMYGFSISGYGYLALSINKVFLGGQTPEITFQTLLVSGIIYILSYLFSFKQYYSFPEERRAREAEKLAKNYF